MGGKWGEMVGNMFPTISPHFPPIFEHFLSFYGIFPIFEVFFGVLLGHFLRGPLKNHKSTKNFVKMHGVPKIIP